MSERRVAPWSDEEIGILQDSKHRTAREVAEDLGRTAKSVQHMRAKLARGWAPSRADLWTEEDDAYVLESRMLPVRAVAKILHRSVAAVSCRRSYLLASLGEADMFGRDKPWHVGRRRLLAKTCGECGCLLAAEFFYFDRGKAEPKCIPCRPKVESTVRRYDDAVRERQKKNVERLQALTIPAERHGEVWTDAECAVLSDPDMTLLEKALTLKRTYKATHSACVKRGFTSKTGPGDPANGLWVIQNPNAEARAS